MYLFQMSGRFYVTSQTDCLAKADIDFNEKHLRTSGRQQQRRLSNDPILFE